VVLVVVVAQKKIAQTKTRTIIANYYYCSRQLIVSVKKNIMIRGRYWQRNITPMIMQQLTIAGIISVKKKYDSAMRTNNHGKLEPRFMFINGTITIMAIVIAVTTQVVVVVVVVQQN